MLAGLIADEGGQALMEYGLILSLIAVCAVTVLTLLGSKIAAHYSELTHSMS
jgi:Flp pilus assembly pilin Flp